MAAWGGERSAPFAKESGSNKCRVGWPQFFVRSRQFHSRDPDCFPEIADEADRAAHSNRAEVSRIPTCKRAFPSLKGYEGCPNAVNVEAKVIDAVGARRRKAEFDPRRDWPQRH